MALSINKASSALLVMDCQEGIVGALTPTERQRLMPVLQRAMASARSAGVPVIHVVVGFREGHPEIGNTGWFKTVKETGRMKIGSPEAQICKEVLPQPGDLIVTKKRMSAFTGSDLEQVLKGRGITTIILTGVSSVGVVESTARDAVDMDLDIVVLGDGCADRDPVVNEAALKHLLPRIASVVNTEEFVTALGGAKQPAAH
jgi:nicotinamidase-related amidase